MSLTSLVLLLLACALSLAAASLPSIVVQASPTFLRRLLFLPASSQRLDPSARDVGVFSSTALVGGLPGIAYTRLLSSDGLSEVCFLRCAQPECDTYSTVVLASGASQGYHPSLTVQSNGFPAVSFSQKSGSVSSVSVALCSDLSCSAFVVNSTLLPMAASSPGWTCAALVEGELTVMFVANLAQASVVYLWQGGASRDVFSVATPDLFQWGSDRNMAVVNKTPLAAVYADGVGLMLIVCAEKTCIRAFVQHPVVDPWSFSTDVGLYPSVAVSPVSGFAVVAYHDATNLQLKLVVCQNFFCTTRVVRSFPSTYGWDPSVIFDPRNNSPLVAFGDPSTSDVVLMACSTPTCVSVSFAGLVSGTLPKRRFETVKLLSSLPFVVAHDTLSSSLVVLLIGGPGGGPLPSCNTAVCPVSVTITSPVTSPFATALPNVVVEGFITPVGQGGQNVVIVANNSTVLSFNQTTGQFTGVVAVPPGTSVVTVTAIDPTTQELLGTASVIIVSDSSGPKLTITTPVNGSSTVSGSALVQGTASAVTGVASIVVVNLATGGTSVTTNSTVPFWSAVVALLPSSTNTIRVTATDNIGQTVSQTVVVLQSGLLPLLTCPGDFTIECGSVAPNPAIRVLNCNAAIAEAPETSVPICGASRVAQKSFSACGSSCSYRITLVDTTAPILTCPPDVTVACDAVSSLASAQATDACSSTPLVSVLNSAAPACGSSFVRTFRASDGCNNAATCMQTVRVTALGSTVTDTVATTTPSGALDAGAIGGLVAGVVLLLLLLLLCFLIALLWLRRRKKERGQLNAPIMMSEFDDEVSSSSTSVIRHSKLYKPPPHQSEDSSDMRDVM